MTLAVPFKARDRRPLRVRSVASVTIEIPILIQPSLTRRDRSLVASTPALKDRAKVNRPLTRPRTEEKKKALQEVTKMFAQFTKQRKIFLLLPLMLMFSAGAVFAQGTAFTFQGKLGDSGSPVNGTFDMQFKLLSDPNCDPTTAGCQIGTTITLNNPLVQVTNGVFSVQLDFGAAALPGAERFLEIGIRRNNTDPYTLLAPRSKITSSPYAIRSRNATNADGLSKACVGCIQSSQINTLDAGKLTGTIPANTISATSLPAGSANYIQANPQAQQAGASFNIAGNGIVGGNVGIGTTAPGAKLDVRGTAVFLGNVGIGTTSPLQKLTVSGTIESTSGGFKFPNGSVQTEAFGPAYTIVRDDHVQLTSTPTSVLRLAFNNDDSYLVEATLYLNNGNLTNFANNNRNVTCRIFNDIPYTVSIGGNLSTTLTLHSIRGGLTFTGLDLLCSVENPQVPSSVFVFSRRMTAIRISKFAIPGQ
jgi:hypothetical protein